MDASGGKNWQKQLRQLPATVPSTSGNTKAVRILPSGVKVKGGMANNSKSKGKKVQPKVQQQMAAKNDVTMDTITFEGLTRTNCRKWWNETPHDEPMKTQLRQAQVQWAIQMPIFCIKDFEVVLWAMIGAYDPHRRQSVFDYEHRQITVSFASTRFTRVFGIPGVQGKKVDKA